MLEWVTEFFTDQGLARTTAEIAGRSVSIIVVIVFSVIANYLAKGLILQVLSRTIKRTRTHWDDFLVKHKVFNKLSHVAPALVIYFTADNILAGYDRLITFVMNAVNIYLLMVGILVVDSLLNTLHDVYKTFEVSREVPIKGFIQVTKIIIYLLAVIFALSVLMDKTPLYILSGMGALMAVIMLIFKDAILGFVAGIQLTANKMVTPGDWIEMNKYGADGDVEEVALTTVKVRNFDKTITTIPTYALISESFRNWRGMEESGGRRIKRSVIIDMNTVKFCDDEMLERFSKIQYIAGYIKGKKEMLAEYNEKYEAEHEHPANKRRLTNIGTFRAYVVAYLKNHDMINKDMTFLVRQLEPTENGLPLQVYVFCKDKAWINYEGIQSDIFDHILAIVPEFDLRVFQNPAGTDFRTLKGVG